MSFSEFGKPYKEPVFSRHDVETADHTQPTSIVQRRSTTFSAPPRSHAIQFFSHNSYRAIALACILFILSAACLYGQNQPFKLPAELPADDRTFIVQELQRLQTKLARLQQGLAPDSRKKARDRTVDAELFLKGVSQALRHETETASAEDVSTIKKWLQRAEERMDFLHSNQEPWAAKKGRVLRGFVSAIDDSVQTYGVVVPESDDGTTPMRLDVVLHGSSKPVGMSEIRLQAHFDAGDSETATASTNKYIEIFPLGRVENGYRWAGESDVFEAIESACQNYRIDRNRIVLRGFSMGASGTWHLGLKRPGYFAAIAPYAGYVDTYTLSRIEGISPNWVRVDPLPPWQERTLHMLDSVDFAANIGVVPTVAAIGGLDPGFFTHVRMNEAVALEGLQLTNLISPLTGHVRDPVTFREQMRQIEIAVNAGRRSGLPDLRFVTWTLKYSRCHWLEILALDEHYRRTEVQATASPDGSVEVSKLLNVRRLAIGPPMLQDAASTLRIDGQDIALPLITSVGQSRKLMLTKTAGRWNCDGNREDVVLTGKRPGVQGPIDDAFTTPFICVRGTGKSWNPSVAAWCDASLRRFRYEWDRYMRGDLPIKDDTDITADDLRTKNLILFGDPGSNSLLRQALPSLPLTWTPTQLQIAGQTYSSTDHAPVLITANPLPDAGDRYLVINSGHSFHERELASLNYLLFPRLGDWGVMKMTANAADWNPGSGDFPEERQQAGFFDENWQNPTVPQD
ncbi:hypothetical protein [Schlesneria sp. T3-172]|uniref:hypothetical protein n=1 Tax=Schlesneria sphaerica TaxID=3373610 RepID=UPI0037C54B7C